MKILQAIIICAVFAIFAGCGEDEAKVPASGKSSSQLQMSEKTAVAENVARHEMSSRDLVRRKLEGLGLRIGFDADRGRLVAVGTHGFSLKGDEKGDELKLTETYDFPDDANDDFETKRFKAMWKAYANGLAEIATHLGMSFNHDEAKDTKGISGLLESSAVQSFAGVKYLTMSESLTADGEYEVSVAVVQSKKTETIYSHSSSGGEAKPGKYTVAEWMENSCELGMICPQSYCDINGVWWRVAGVPVDLSSGRKSKRVAVLTEKAKRYAYEAAMRTIAVGVSASTSASSSRTLIGDGDKIQEKLLRTVRIKPLNTILPVDSSQINFFELDKVNPMTGKPVRSVVAALRSGKGIPRLERKTDVGSGRTQNGTAMDQAKTFLEQKRWRLGREFAKENNFAVALGGAAFKYSSDMDDADFAKKRYEAVQQALMEAAMNVAFTYQTRADFSEDSLFQEGQVKNCARRTFRNEEAFSKLFGNMLSFCDDASAIRDMKMVSGAWQMAVSSIDKSNGEVDESTLREGMGEVTSEMPLRGLSVVQQFESLIDDVYQVVLVVRHSPQDGPKELMSFISEDRLSADVGKLSLSKWIESQDFGLIAGPRKYIDDKGCLWAMGIVPAAECHRPYGSSLDRMARECAAFAFGGDVRAQFRKHDVARSHSSVEYVDRKMSIEYEAAVKTYPQELEAYFHRPYTHPLTGRKGVVSVCALCQGYSNWQQKRMVREIEETKQRQIEKGRQEGMRDAMRIIKEQAAK